MSSYSSLNPDEFSPPEYTDLSVSRIYIDPYKIVRTTNDPS